MKYNLSRHRRKNHAENRYFGYCGAGIESGGIWGNRILYLLYFQKEKTLKCINKKYQHFKKEIPSENQRLISMLKESLRQTGFLLKQKEAAAAAAILFALVIWNYL